MDGLTAARKKAHFLGTSAAGYESVLYIEEHYVERERRRHREEFPIANIVLSFLYVLRVPRFDLESVSSPVTADSYIQNHNRKKARRVPIDIYWNSLDRNITH